MALGGVVGCGGGGDTGALDGGEMACGRVCDDGLFCNGRERCALGAPGADIDGCVSGAPPCGEAECEEERESCEDGVCPDRDGDGATDIACGGRDCDDEDPERYPGNVEVCDAQGLDEDCDESTFGIRDADRDGFPDAACCNGSRCGTDCDDALGISNPGESERCDTVDNDCDGEVDEGVLSRWIVDADGDGFGSAAEDAEIRLGCDRPDGFAETAGDCGDGDRLINPSAAEVCDEEGIDENCDGSANPPDFCECVRGVMPRSCLQSVGACRDGVERCVDGGWGACSIEGTPEVCDGVVDEDCDGQVDERLTVRCYPDVDNDTYPALEARRMDVCPVAGRDAVGGCPAGSTNRMPSVTTADCDDAVSTTSPAGLERCDGSIDEDCDGRVDEMLAVTCYPDEDNDSYAPSGAAAAMVCRDVERMERGFCPLNYTERAPAGTESDCDDSASTTNPAGSEICNGRDDNCDERTDNIPSAGDNYCEDPRSGGEGTRECRDAACGGALGTQACESCEWSECVREGGRECRDATDCSPDGGILCRQSDVACEECRCVYPAEEAEVCDHWNQDCDGRVDEGVGFGGCELRADATEGDFASGPWRCQDFELAASACTLDSDRLALAGSMDVVPKVAYLDGPFDLSGETFVATRTLVARASTSDSAPLPRSVALFLLSDSTAGSPRNYGLPSGEGYALVYDFGERTLRLLRGSESAELMMVAEAALSSACDPPAGSSEGGEYRLSMRVEQGLGGDSEGARVTFAFRGEGLSGDGSCGTELTFEDEDFVRSFYGRQTTVDGSRLRTFYAGVASGTSDAADAGTYLVTEFELAREDSDLLSCTACRPYAGAGDY